MVPLSLSGPGLGPDLPWWVVCAPVAGDYIQELLHSLSEHPCSPVHLDAHTSQVGDLPAGLLPDA